MVAAERRTTIMTMMKSSSQSEDVVSQFGPPEWTSPDDRQFFWLEPREFLSSAEEASEETPLAVECQSFDSMRINGGVAAGGMWRVPEYHGTCCNIHLTTASGSPLYSLHYKRYGQAC